LGGVFGRRSAADRRETEVGARRLMTCRAGGVFRRCLLRVLETIRTQPGTAGFAGPERAEPSGEVREGRAETVGPNRCGGRTTADCRPDHSRTVR
jgi:hypothetical protein